MGNCSGCGVGIVWALSPKGEKPPIELATNPAANVLLLNPKGFGSPLAITLSGLALLTARENGLPLHYNHFATCEHRERFKR